jgi:hypothetical protein
MLVQQVEEYMYTLPSVEAKAHVIMMEACKLQDCKINQQSWGVNYQMRRPINSVIWMEACIHYQDWGVRLTLREPLTEKVAGPCDLDGSMRCIYHGSFSRLPDAQ